MLHFNIPKYLLKKYCTQTKEGLSYIFFFSFFLTTFLTKDVKQDLKCENAGRNPAL